MRFALPEGGIPSPNEAQSVQVSDVGSPVPRDLCKAALNDPRSETQCTSQGHQGWAELVTGSDRKLTGRGADFSGIYSDLREVNYRLRVMT